MNTIDNRAVMDRAVAYLITQYSPKGTLYRLGDAGLDTG